MHGESAWTQPLLCVFVMYQEKKQTNASNLRVTPLAQKPNGPHERIHLSVDKVRAI